ncbi:MAG: hypothetical protein JWP25_3409 [Bradyrhizobium sp.]|jgi:hypothetical protein|nr:hypothetical protein [Bradyrhizobium sp.]MEA2865682.1 hypothetical protein [Bradyrhizobium sp.]
MSVAMGAVAGEAEPINGRAFARPLANLPYGLFPVYFKIQSP